MSLQNKKEILMDIVKNDYPGYWVEKKEILTYLQDIQELRNTLAHSIIDVSDDALSRPIEEGVGFIQWRKGKPITNIEFEDFEARAGTVISTLSDIKQLLPFKEKSIA